VTCGVLRCRGNFPPTLAISAKWGMICAQRSEFPGDVWATECTEFRRNMFLMFYQELGLLGAKGGSWVADEFSPNARKSAGGERFAPNGVSSQGISVQRSALNPGRRCS